ncbi:AraC family transcriptional regulator [uncultured Cyclobacterium sp.]|uniref:helix-turn-helix domain-containing protein n=1 Tax=uncultured Cyclobacterium sp. TaxID=453820 RepID=UPI0030EE5C77|tara:strand:- start:1641 stop:2228 length:588 start_codon:yes stop_codon:yes gene_type:complete
MKIYLKYNYKVVCETLVREQLEKFNIPWSAINSSEFEILDGLPEETKFSLIQSLKNYGITVLDDQKETLVDRIKNTIDEMLNDENARHLKVSSYLSDKLDYTYSYLSSVFSENTYSSIENYLILRKVDLVKELLQEGNLNLTEIAYRLNYSSVSHLSGQFKKTTGLTPSSFQRIMKRKKSLNAYIDKTIKLVDEQ